jgi:hypothetical protein
MSRTADAIREREQGKKQPKPDATPAKPKK